MNLETQIPRTVRAQLPHSFRTHDYQGVWLPFDGDRIALRKTIESTLRQALSQPTGYLEVRDDGPHWVGDEAVIEKRLSHSHTHSHTHSHSNSHSNSHSHEEAPSNDHRDFSNSIHLSYSHSQNLALLVWGSQPIGVDIEQADRKFTLPLSAIAERYFHPSERQKFQGPGLGQPSATLNHDFLALWCKKEAYGKMTREGLKSSIQLAMDPMPTDAQITPVSVAPENWIAWVSVRRVGG